MTSFISKSITEHKVKRTDSGEFRSDMQDHDHSHCKGNDMHKRGGTFEDDGIRNFNVSRITVRDDAGRPGNRRRRAHEGAQRQRYLLAYCIEVAEPHDV